jgi:hypothetical protein
MVRERRPRVRQPIDPEPEEQASLLDVVDSVLNKGAVLNGDLILGVANVDLIYVKLSVLVSALDRVMKPLLADGSDKAKPRRRGQKSPKIR